MGQCSLSEDVIFESLKKELIELLNYLTWLLTGIMSMDLSRPLSMIQQGSFVVYMLNYKEMEISSSYVYPYWAHVLGWIMSMSSILVVPLFAIVQICLGTGSFRQVSVWYLVFVISYHILSYNRSSLKLLMLSAQDYFDLC